MALNTNLISYWKLDESSGNAADSVGSNTGTNTGVTYSTGKINNGAVFDASSDKLDCGTDSSLNITSSYSISGWLKPSSLPSSGGQAVWLARESSGGYYTSLYNNSGTQYLRLLNQNGASSSYVDIAVTLSTSVFTFVTWVYDDTADTMKLYINGALQGSGSSKTVNPSSGSRNFYLGCYVTNTLPYSGVIDEVGIWSRALSTDEVQKLYNAGNGNQYSFTDDLTTALIAYYKLDESSGNAADSSGNSRTLTNNATVTYGAAKINNGAIFSSASKQNLSTTNFIGAGSTGVTFSCWVKYTSLPVAGYNPGGVMAGGGNSPYVTHFLRLQNNPSGTYKWYWSRVRNGAATTFDLSASAGTPSTGVWYHMVGVTNGVDSAKLYINGSEVATTSTTDVLNGTSGSNTDASFRLGREFYTGDDSASRYLDGTMDEVGIWARALSASEVSSLYNSGNGLQYPFSSTQTDTSKMFLMF